MNTPLRRRRRRLSSGQSRALPRGSLFPFTSIAIDNFNLIVCALIAFLIAVIAPFVNSAIPNPLLIIRKYHFYQVNGEHGISGYVLISKKKYRNKQELKLVKRMFDFLLLDVERK